MYICLLVINSFFILLFFFLEVFVFIYKKLFLFFVVIIYEWDDVFVDGSVWENVIELELLIKDRFWRVVVFVILLLKLYLLISFVVDIV